MGSFVMGLVEVAGHAYSLGSAQVGVGTLGCNLTFDPERLVSLSQLIQADSQCNCQSMAFQKFAFFYPYWPKSERTFPYGSNPCPLAQLPNRVAK